MGCLVLTGCQTVKSNNPEELSFTVPQGSILTLKKKMTIPELYSHGVIQYGKEITDDDIDDYYINCRLDFNQLGPRTIEPEAFVVTTTYDGWEWVSDSGILRYYTEVYLSSNKNTDVIKLECQEYGDQLDYPFSVAQMQKALGEYFSFKFNDS